jgi:hypothetical protein
MVIMRWFAVALALVPAAFAQHFAMSSISVKRGAGGPGEMTGVWGPPAPAPIVTGAPYSADELQDYMPPDGRSAPRSNVIGRYARDYQGRTRTVSALKPAPVWLTEILDPVAGVAYLLNEPDKIACQMQLPPALASAPRPPPSRARVESLGTSIIEGVMAEGTRTTFPGRAIETWESPELKVTLRTRSSNGYSSRLINLSRGEPDPALFRPPAGYTVIHQDAPFPMTIRFQE